jgi:hypothetical protein
MFFEFIIVNVKYSEIFSTNDCAYVSVQNLSPETQSTFISITNLVFIVTRILMPFFMIINAKLSR